MAESRYSSPRVADQGYATTDRCLTSLLYIELAAQSEEVKTHSVNDNLCKPVYAGCHGHRSPHRDDHLAMDLSTLLRDLATLYRRYGNINVVIETPHHIYTIQRVDDDIWNIDKNVSAVIETEQVDNTTPTIPHREKKRPNTRRVQSQTSSRVADQTSSRRVNGQSATAATT